MDIKVFLNNGETVEGEGNVDEMGITIRMPVKVLIAGKEDEASMTMVPWTSVSKFEYVVTQDMIAAQAAVLAHQGGNNAEADLANQNSSHPENNMPNRAQRRAAARA